LHFLGLHERGTLIFNGVIFQTEYMPNLYCEFFAGGGMARAGLGAGWQCVFSNDFDPRKARTYAENWGSDVLHARDVRSLGSNDVPDNADLYWASFPCQDLSLAGMGAGLRGNRSGTFWPFWSLVREKAVHGSAPSIIVLENVCGTLTSHAGADFVAICKALAETDYKFGAVIIDAKHFVPQSRPRLFVVGVRGHESIPTTLLATEPSRVWHGTSIERAHQRLPLELQREWVWWRLPSPPSRETELADIIEENPQDVSWHSASETAALIEMMSQGHRELVETAVLSGESVTGAVYKRTRFDHNGNKIQRAEVRFDGLAGCLRTPGGGSSRQLILQISAGAVRSRLLSSREAARLMGLSDSYKLPKNYNEAYHLLGDGLAVPAVAFLSDALLAPLMSSIRAISETVA
jgi:DNA (cytosine-5)-methyltransferase 1